jgi:hypothetical protein
MSMAINEKDLRLLACLSLTVMAAFMTVGAWAGYGLGVNERRVETLKEVQTCWDKGYHLAQCALENHWPIEFGCRNVKIDGQDISACGMNSADPYIMPNGKEGCAIGYDERPAAKVPVSCEVVWESLEDWPAFYKGEK